MMKGSPISPAVYLCVITFGAATWIDLNGVWVELPLIVHRLPEGWNLPSFMAVIVQLACIGPLMYVLASYLRPKGVAKHTPLLILAMLVFNAVCTLLLAGFWDVTAAFAGRDRSVALFVLFFGLSLADCTSSVTFLPWMARLKGEYMTAYFVGMGVSGLIPSVLALIQGAGRFECVGSIVETSILNSSSGAFDQLNKTVFYPQQLPVLFNTHVMFGILFVCLLGSIIGYTMLNVTKTGKRARVKNEMKPVSCDILSSDEIGNSKQTLPGKETIDLLKPGNICAEDIDPFWSNGAEFDCKQKVEQLPKSEYLMLLLITAWICALMNGVLPSIQSFACLPYGQLVYHLSACLSAIANPLASFSVGFVNSKATGILWTLTATTTVLAGYIITNAALSPVPLMVGTLYGDIIMVSYSCFLCAIINYRLDLRPYERSVALDSIICMFALRSTRLPSLCLLIGHC